MPAVHGDEPFGGSFHATVNVGDTGFYFTFGGGGEEAVKRLLCIAMVATLPGDQLEHVFAPLRNAFAAVHTGPYLLPWEPAQVHVYSEPVDKKTVKILRRFQGR